MFHIEFVHEKDGETLMIPCECTMIKLVHHGDNFLYRCRVSKNPKEDRLFKIPYFTIGDIWVTDDWDHTPGRWIYES